MMKDAPKSSLPNIKISFREKSTDTTKKVADFLKPARIPEVFVNIQHLQI